MTGDETGMWVRMAFELKRAVAKAKRTKPDLAGRLNVRYAAVVQRIRDGQAGLSPKPWPFEASHNRRSHAVSSVERVAWSLISRGAS
jgi:hypothetical protein